MPEARRRRPRRLGVVVLLALLLAGVSAAEEPSRAGGARPSLVRDPEDGAIDLSGWLATRTGVLPIPVPITEPAVGYGAALALVKFQRRRARRGAEGPAGTERKADTAQHRRRRRGAHRERDLGRVRRVHRPLQGGPLALQGGGLEALADARLLRLERAGLRLHHGRLGRLPGARAPPREERPLRRACSSRTSTRRSRSTCRSSRPRSRSPSST